MSTREIAELIGKTHSNIKISAERLAECGTLALQESKFNHNGNEYTEYLLTKRDSLVLVAQNSPKFTAAIVDRWQELEAANKPVLPRSFSEALQLAADQAKQLEEQAPKIEVYEKLAARTSDVNTTALAKQLGITAIKLNKFLKLEGIKCQFRDYPAAKYADWFNVIPIVSNGGHEGTQCLITPLGQIEIAKRFNK